MDNDANRSHTTVPPRPSQVPRPVRPTLGATEAAQTVTSHVTAWLRDRHYVSSRDIRRQATIALLPIQPDAAYIYQHGRDAL